MSEKLLTHDKPRLENHRERFKKLTATGLLTLGALGLAGCDDGPSKEFSKSYHNVDVNSGDTMSGIINKECPHLPIRNIIDSGADKLGQYNGTNDQVEAGKKLKIPDNLCEVLESK